MGHILDKSGNTSDIYNWNFSNAINMSYILNSCENLTNTFIMNTLNVNNIRFIFGFCGYIFLLLNI